MIHETITLQAEGSLSEASLVTYMIDNSQEFMIHTRPVIVICPGGGYCFLSDREGEMLALQYNAMGYHAAVLKYSVAPAVYPAALLELAEAVRLLRKRADVWQIDPDKIIVQGSSAGGHLAASYGMFWKEEWVAQSLSINEDDREILRPNAMILNYPVITSGEYAHRDSFVNLLGSRYEELVEKMSLENQVNADTPPAFIWHTFEDGCVPVENSLLLVGAMRRHMIPVEFHLYPQGGHGLSLADESTATPDGGNIEPGCQSWIILLRTWLRSLGKRNL